MRNFDCSIADMRKRVFAEVAKLAYEGGDYYKRMERLPYEILPGEVGKERDSIFLERAIVGERIRLAMGLPVRQMDEYTTLSDGVEESAVAQKYYDPPLVNIIKFACHACPETHYKITNACQGCIARHCQRACPRDAIYFENGRAQIDQSKCIKCGKCKAACSYQAIIKFERPCAEACGMDAIGKDEQGRAVINQDKCVSCGMCLVNCPFGAIVDKGQLFQLIHSIKRGDKVIAIIAPAFWGQFGDEATPGKLVQAMKALGFHSVEEVAIGADLCAVEEADEFVRHVPAKQPFMATSCCPAWSVMAKKEFPGMAPYISMTMTPMVLTARLQKRKDPKCKVALIGPCAAKKLEAIADYGSILALSYVAAQRTFYGYNDMADAKALLESIARSFGYIYGRESNVRVNTISQSPTMTTAGSGVKGMDKLFDFANRMSPLGNASAAECADYCIVMFSDLTRKVTMQNLYHDGGFSSVGMSLRAMATYEKGLDEYKDENGKIIYG